MWRSWLIISGVVLGVLVSVASADSPAPTPDPEKISALGIEEKVDAVIDAVVSRQRATSSLVASFEQRKINALLLEPVVSHGTFRYVAPDQVRWDYEQPEEMVVVFADDLLTTYYPQERRAERAQIGSRQKRFVRFLGGTQPLDELMKQFQMQFADPGAPDPYQIELTPMSRMLSERLESIHVEIHRQLLLPVTFEYREPDGDTTSFAFAEIQRNVPVDTQVFDLKLGPEVTVESVVVGSNPVY